MNDYEFIQAIESELKKSNDYAALMGNLKDVHPLQVHKSFLFLYFIYLFIIVFCFSTVHNAYIILYRFFIFLFENNIKKNLK